MGQELLIKLQDLQGKNGQILTILVQEIMKNPQHLVYMGTQNTIKLYRVLREQTEETYIK